MNEVNVQRLMELRGEIPRRSSTPRPSQPAPSAAGRLEGCVSAKSANQEAKPFRILFLVEAHHGSAELAAVITSLPITCRLIHKQTFAVSRNYLILHMVGRFDQVWKYLSSLLLLYKSSQTQIHEKKEF